MKKNLLIFIGVLLSTIGVYAQIPAFEKEKDEIYIPKDSKAIYWLKVKCISCAEPKKSKFILWKPKCGELTYCDKCLYPDSLISRSALDSIEIYFKSDTGFYLPIEVKYNKENIGNKIYFKLANADTSIKNSKATQIELTVKEKLETNVTDSMSYRFMIGTNFDFIDGTKPKDVYYHLQLFQPKAFNDWLGFVGGIQQVRTSSQKNTPYVNEDTAKKYLDNNIRTPEYDVLNSDSVRIYRLNREAVTFDNVTTSSIFQIYIEPTFRLFKQSPSGVSKTNLYALFHADVQRVSVTTQSTARYTDKAVDSSRARVIPNRMLSVYKVVENGSVIETRAEFFHFNFAPGILLHHENKYVDLYTKFMVGGMKFKPEEWKGFYGCELGIRVPKVNIMFGAEYRGNFYQPDPLYFNVYLSKVFTLEKIAELISK